MVEPRPTTATKITTSTTEDVAWREYDIQEQDSDEDVTVGFSFFEPKDEKAFEIFEYQVSSSTPTLKLTHQESYTQSTGMSIWRGSEVLAEYIKQNPEIVYQKSVLELGAGVGLVGLTAHYLGASQVLWTDGDEEVLENLRQNVQRNIPNGFNNGSNSDGSTTRESSRHDWYCPQLIWGKNVERFRNEYGRSQIILGTDLFYMTKSLGPLFETVHDLLTLNDDDDNDDGTFLAVLTCSAQSSRSTIVNIANQYGFSCTRISATTKTTRDINTEGSYNMNENELDNTNDKRNDDDDDDENDDDRIYIFRRHKVPGLE